MVSSEKETEVAGQFADQFQDNYVDLETVEVQPKILMMRHNI